MCEILWKNTVEQGRPQITIRRMRGACWISKFTRTHAHTHTICNNYFFSTAKMVTRTRVSVRYTYIACLVLTLTVHLSIFILVFNQLDTQSLFHNKFYFMPVHVSSTCAHHQEVRIALHSLWYHHTYRCRGMK